MSVATQTLSDLYGPGAGRAPTTSARITPGATGGGGFRATTPQEASPDLSRAFTSMAAARPLYGIAVLAVLLVGLSLLARHFGSEDEFREIRLSAYNVIVIGLAAIVGILFWKVLLTRVQIPHLTAAVLAV